MATAVLEDLSLSLESSFALPYELKEAPSPDTVAMLDWQSTLSPSRWSCIKLSNVEPCVNKAVAHLTSLKEKLAECARNQLCTTVTQVTVPESRSETPKSIHKDGDGRQTLTGSRQGQPSQLMIEGITTGIPVEKQSKPPARKVGLIIIDFF